MNLAFSPLSSVKAGPLLVPLIPAQAGTQADSVAGGEAAWIPAFAGTIGEGGRK